jgi:hypothetical protein
MTEPRRASLLRGVSISIIFFGVLILGASRAAAQDCLGRIASFSEPVADYNPFSPVAHRATFAVTIENNGAAACRYRLRAKGLAQNNGFSFRIASADGDLLLDSKAAIAAGTGAGIVSRLLEPAETQRLELVYSLPEGQYLLPGQLRAEAELVLTEADSAGESQSALHAAPLPLLCSIEDHLGVNIAGAGLMKTVDFGELVEGDSRRVVIEARANRSFLLEIESLHGGALVMEPPYQDWRIEYDANLNGRTLKLPFKAGPYERGGISGQSFSLDFRIGETASKRAGLYTDEITVTIRPAL